MKSLLSYLFVFCCIGLVYASDLSHELILKNNQGVMLSQVSGMTTYGDTVFFVAQRDNAIYFAKQSKLSSAFHNSKPDLSLDAVSLNGQLPTIASWEAIAFGVKAGSLRVFLSHEHDKGDGFHQIYSAQVEFADSITIGELKPFGGSLPITQNDAIPANKRSNYGYEAIAWNDKLQKLVAVPELSEQEVVFVSRPETRIKFDNSNHRFRFSDMESVSQNCAIFTSFCHTSDSLCANSNSSVLSLVTANISLDKLNVVDRQDISQHHLKVKVIPSLANGDTKAALFNAEGITLFEQGILLVNDNVPKGKARTVVRYIPTISVDDGDCKIKYLQ